MGIGTDTPNDAPQGEGNTKLIQEGLALSPVANSPQGMCRTYGTLGCERATLLNSEVNTMHANKRAPTKFYTIYHTRVWIFMGR